MIPTVHCCTAQIDMNVLDQEFCFSFALLYIAVSKRSCGISIYKCPVKNERVRTSSENSQPKKPNPAPSMPSLMLHFHYHVDPSFVHSLSPSDVAHTTAIASHDIAPSSTTTPALLGRTRLSRARRILPIDLRTVCIEVACRLSGRRGSVRVRQRLLGAGVRKVPLLRTRSTGVRAASGASRFLRWGWSPRLGRGR